MKPILILHVTCQQAHNTTVYVKPKKTAQLIILWFRN